MIIGDFGDDAAKRFVEYFTTNIRSSNARADYTQVVAQFLGWYEKWDLPLRSIEPVQVAASLELFQKRLAAPSVKQHQAVVRMPFEGLVTGHTTLVKPNAAVRGPEHVVARGKSWSSQPWFLGNTSIASRPYKKTSMAP